LITEEDRSGCVLPGSIHVCGVCPETVLKVRVRHQLRCLRMLWFAIEDFRDGLTFIWRKSRNENQISYAVFLGRRDHRASIGVRHQNDGAVDPFERAVESPGVIGDELSRGSAPRHSERRDLF
jgi:hypothetical protein